MASKRTDSDQDEDEDPWGLNQLEAEALAALRIIGTRSAGLGITIPPMKENTVVKGRFGGFGFANQQEEDRMQPITSGLMRW